MRKQHEAPRWLPSLHVLRGIAALLVALLHLSRYWPSFVHLPWRLTVLSYSAVYLFFVMSGVMMVHITWDRPKGFSPAGRFLLARARRTVPPYWAALALAVVVYASLPHAAAEMDMRPPYTLSFLAANAFGLQQHILPVSWTLGYEWRFYAAFAFLCVLGGWRPWVLAVPWLALLLLHHSDQPYGVLSSHLFGVLVGALLGEWIARRGTAGSVVVPAFAFVAMFELGIRWRLFSHGEWSYPIVMAPLVLAAVRWDAQRRPSYPKPLTLLGDYSYALYLTHVPLIWVAMAFCGVTDGAVRR